MAAFPALLALLLLASSLRGASACADLLSPQDCAIVHNNNETDNYNYCHIYADECSETCGCDYDPALDRGQWGLDDAHYKGDDFRCVHGADFSDWMGFNCTLYEGARWCAIDDDGEVTEGPGWCAWFEPEACDVPMEERWPKHENYANDDGQWAKSCCCNSGLADTYPYDDGGGSNCVDTVRSNNGWDWHDKNGYSCRAYHFGSFCTVDGLPGNGWDVEKYLSIDGYAWDGMSALEACCACGGGTNAPTDLIAANSETATPTASNSTTSGAAAPNSTTSGAAAPNKTTFWASVLFLATVSAVSTSL